MLERKTEIVDDTAGGGLSQAEYGSDLVIEMLRGLDIPYIALNPGSSFRGIHDSLVNFPPGNDPEMIVCLHEEIAIALAHGYARATDRPLVAAVHDVVGLQHASMAIFNAWCDRVPLIVIGGTGPVNTENRRPHIDWVHTANVQGNQVRDYVKWDDQPASVEAFPEALMRAYRIAMTDPKGPVYVCFDVDLQEQPITTPLILPDMQRFRPPTQLAPDPDALARAAELLAGAAHPVIVADDTGRDPAAVRPLGELAELLGAPVLTVGSRFAIATNHPLNLGMAREEVLADADVVLALDVYDLGAALCTTGRERGDRPLIAPTTKVIHIGVDDLLQHSWVSDRGRLFPVDVPITANTGLALPMLVDLCRRALDRDPASARRIDERRAAAQKLHETVRERALTTARGRWDNRPISLDRLYGDTYDVIKGMPWTVVHSGYSRAWAGASWEFTEWEQMAGGGRGSGLGQGACAPLGAALAYKDSGRLCVSIVGDGELLYTPSALWTASNLSLPLLMIVNDNRSYGNDESHQNHLARVRGRPVENRGIGIYLEEPATDFATLAKSFDVEAFGPVEDPSALRGVLDRAVSIVAKERRPVLVDVVTERMARG